MASAVSIDHSTVIDGAVVNNDVFSCGKIVFLVV
jgi:hypothetical protein